jgi:ribosomal protein S18 acetylase RimI-like enzyme
VAKKDGEIVGYISLRKKNQRGEIGFLAVAKSYQRSSIGSQLGLYIASHAKKQGCKKLTLAVLSTNRKAIQLYKKFGFRRTRTIQKRKGSKIVTKWGMEKTL